MKHLKLYENFNKNIADIDDEEELKEPIGIDNLECEGSNGSECIFSPLESDMVDDWNSDETIKKWVQEKRVFLQEIKYDEWAIYAKTGDREVKKYIINNFSW